MPSLVVTEDITSIAAAEAKFGLSRSPALNLFVDHPNFAMLTSGNDLIFDMSLG